MNLMYKFKHPELLFIHLKNTSNTSWNGKYSRWGWSSYLLLGR